MEKQCSKCKQILDFSNFYKDARTKDSLHSACKSCELQSSRNYRIKNLEKVKEAKKKYYDENRTEDIKKSREYYLNHKSNIQEYAKLHYQKNKEKIKSYKTNYLINNREKVRAYRNKHNEENREKVRQIQKAYSEKNKEKLFEYHKNYRIENKEQRYANESRRRARRAGNSGSHTGAEIEYLKQIQNFQCLMCKKFEPEIKLTLDHILPISKGGGDGIGNCQMLCGPCNSSKNAKFIDFRGAKPPKKIKNSI